jgi:hypothetical protein
MTAIIAKHLKNLNTAELRTIPTPSLSFPILVRIMLFIGKPLFWKKQYFLRLILVCI